MSPDYSSPEQTHWGQLRQPVPRKQDWAYLRLRDWILDGELAQGALLDETKLAEQLNLSRVPVRDALSRLSSEGLVIDRPHQRRIVSPMSLAGAEDVYAGRVVLEVMLGREATARATDEDKARVSAALETQRRKIEAGDDREARRYDRVFHFTMYEIAGMGHSLSALEKLRILSERYIHLYMSSPDRLRSSLEEHQRIFEAFRDGDAEQVAALTESHVQDGIAVLRTLLAAP